MQPGLRSNLGLCRRCISINKHRTHKVATKTVFVLMKLAFNGSTERGVVKKFHKNNYGCSDGALCLIKP